MQKNLDKLFSTTKFKGVKRYSVKEILIAPIETLLGYTDKLSKIKLTDGQTKTLKEIFNYDNPDFRKKDATFYCGLLYEEITPCYVYLLFL